MPVKEKVERNKQIYADKKAMSWTKLMFKWEFSYATLHRIIKREQKRELKNRGKVLESK